MPRALPPLADELARQILQAEDFVSRLENAENRLKRLEPTGPVITLTALELAYELAYLRVFIAWEAFLEQTFIRLLCGYTHSRGQEPLAANITYAKTIEDATKLVLNGRDYILWHDPNKVLRRAQNFFVNGRFEITLASSSTRIGWYSAIRHRIAHSQDHAKFQFDAATMRLSARRYRGGRPGRFLRDWSTGSVP